MLMNIGVDRADLYQQLRSVDWTFERVGTRTETHGIHPYPAKFIPQIPRALISTLYPSDGSLILDPFCGSGTTLVEAALADAPAIGVDVNPLACLISRVKVTPLNGSLVSYLDGIIQQTHQLKAEIPSIPALDHWFKSEIQEELAALLLAVDGISDPSVRDAFRVAVSSIIVRVSNQESDTRYAAIDKDLKGATVRDLFVRAVQLIDKALRSTWPSLLRPPEIEVLNRDILHVEPADFPRPVSLVVTSPPYPNAYEYWLYHKYRMYWLGMDPITVRKNEIGARPHYFKRNPQTALDFEKQMEAVFSLLRKILVKNGHVCFQVGRSIIRGEWIDNARLLTRAAAQSGFEIAISLDRMIPKQRKAFNPKNSKISREDILIFRLVDV